MITTPQGGSGDDPYPYIPLHTPTYPYTPLYTPIYPYIPLDWCITWFSCTGRMTSTPAHTKLCDKFQDKVLRAIRHCYIAAGPGKKPDAT